jgi:hypothetical protein
MYTIEEKGDIVTVKVKTHNGDIVEHNVVKVSGCKIRPGGTASNKITIKNAYTLGTYIKEEDDLPYCCAVMGFESRPHDFRTCGEVREHSEIFIIETLDLDEKVRWLAMSEIPEDCRCHFLNFDFVDDGGKILRRLRIDPFLGGSKVIDA